MGEDHRFVVLVPADLEVLMIGFAEDVHDLPTTHTVSVNTVRFKPIADARLDRRVPLVHTRY